MRCGLDGKWSVVSEWWGLVARGQAVFVEADLQVGLATPHRTAATSSVISSAREVSPVNAACAVRIACQRVQVRLYEVAALDDSLASVFAYVVGR